MKQPKLTIPKTRFESVLDAIGITIFIMTLGYLFFHFGSLPDQVPGHFNAVGEVNRWGSKMELIILPVIGGSMWLLFTVLEKYPHTFNYVNLRANNLEAQYKNGRLMLNVLKNETVLLFSLLTYLTIQIALGEAEGLGPWFLPLFMGVIMGSLLVFVVRMLRM